MPFIQTLVERKNILHFHNAFVPPRVQAKCWARQARLKGSRPSWENFGTDIRQALKCPLSLFSHKGKNVFLKGLTQPSKCGKHYITVSFSVCKLFRTWEKPCQPLVSCRTTNHWEFVPMSSSSTDRWSPGINLKMCLRTLPRLLFLGRVPNKEETLFSSQQGEREPLLPAIPELLERLRAWWWLLEPDENLLDMPCVGKSVKKQPSSLVLAALQGPGELRSPNTLARSLSSVIMLL